MEWEEIMKMLKKLEKQQEEIKQLIEQYKKEAEDYK